MKFFLNFIPIVLQNLSVSYKNISIFSLICTTKFRGRPLLFLSILLFLVTGCDKQKKEDFHTLMGADTSIWKFIETHEDYQNIEVFKHLYERNKHLQFLRQEELLIPKVIHFIWLGPNPFPQESIENISSWVENHPGWTIKFWTDRRRVLPHPTMELHLVSTFNFEYLSDYYEDSDNYAEKSDLLRYEILNQEGGLYVDHDVKCFKPFTPFHYNFHLYCGLEPPHQPILSSSVSVNNNLIGTIPAHPMIKKTIENVNKRWVKIGAAYPGDDKDSVVCRVGNRSFASFDDAVKELQGSNDLKNIVFPAAYFNGIDDRFALYAHHYYASTWFEDETKFERNVRKRLISISRKNNQILLFNAIILTTNLFLFLCLFFQFHRLRQFIKKNQ